ncbi:conserved repeat domain-containing protein [Lentzea fradiae]|uniref:Conserved repeat domain-containing protein n=1 Tax=Lentzea fradiae TaxID=200378 RepID=A0A1G7KIK7_9PSEU|nr:hypothetical protein [Lentzea fradiae]SDF36629.1 conserved repeat domain-containing protein [Lentzea fradiae]
MRVPILLAVALLVALLSPGPPVGAAEVWRTQFDEAVYGDVAIIGESVVTCPTREQAGPLPRYPPQSCVDALHQQGRGPSAQNNAHRMSWTDTDGDSRTFNSSSAQLALPPGASVAYAKLGWAGNTACDRATPPPGGPRDPVLFNGTAISPGSFRADAPGEISGTDNAFYSAEADVTRYVTGGTVTVGNVWTPQGFDCFGGWSLTVVWKFPAATAAAPAKRHVTVHGGHVRLPTRVPVLRTPIAPTHPAGGSVRLSFTAYEGDWAGEGDQLLVNGTSVGGRNVFASSAQGSAHPNNMSVDARTLTVPDGVLQPGSKSAELTFQRDEDAFLVQSIAWSFPLPELVLAVSPEHAEAHPGGTVTQTATVTNAGDAPAAEVTVCGQQIGALAPHATATRTCSSTAAQDDYQATVTAGGVSLAGDQLTAGAASTVDVLHPALRATAPAEPVTALPGQAVTFTTTVTNTGDTPLHGLTARAASGCEPMQDRLDPGAGATVDCTAPAGEESGALTATVTASDKLGGTVEATASVQVKVIYPRLTITAVWSTDRAPEGEVVTVTITVGNPSPHTIENVRVEGEPAACRRVFPVLRPFERITYTCQVTVPVNARLTVSGRGVGQAVTESAVVRIESVTAEPLPVQPPPVTPPPPSSPAPDEPDPPAPAEPQPPRPVSEVRQLSKPAVGGAAAVISIVGMAVVASALAGLGRR